MQVELLGLGQDQKDCTRVTYAQAFWFKLETCIRMINDGIFLQYEILFRIFMNTTLIWELDHGVDFYLCLICLILGVENPHTDDVHMVCNGDQK